MAGGHKRVSEVQASSVLEIGINTDLKVQSKSRAE